MTGHTITRLIVAFIASTLGAWNVGRTVGETRAIARLQSAMDDLRSADRELKLADERLKQADEKLKLACWGRI